MSPDLPDAVLRAIAASPIAAGVFLGLLLVARVLDRHLTALTARIAEHVDSHADVASALGRVASALRGRRTTDVNEQAAPRRRAPREAPAEPGD